MEMYGSVREIFQKAGLYGKTLLSARDFRNFCMGRRQ